MKLKRRRSGVHRRAGTSRVKRMIRRAVPDRDTLAAHPWLRPVAQRLLHARLWHMQHEAVARGVAIGLFWAFAIPLGQILVESAIDGLMPAMKDTKADVRQQAAFALGQIR